MSRFGETAADDLFRADAERLGYLDPTRCGPEDPCNSCLNDLGRCEKLREPGLGRGLRAYYSDFSMIQPEVLDKELPVIELVGLNLELAIREAVDDE